MCIMEAREGQHESTIAQACAHNISTVISDYTMFEKMLNARGQYDEGNKVRETRESLVRCYDAALDLYSAFIADAIRHEAGHLDLRHPEQAQFENLDELVRNVVRRDAQHAHVYETR